MKKFSDEEIQNALDAGENLTSEDADIKQYKLLFTALEKTPRATLPLAFSASLVRKIKAKQLRRQDLKLNLLVGFLLTSGLGAGYLCLIWFSPNMVKQFMQILSLYKGIGLLILFTLLLFYWGERKLLSPAKPS
ncbi:hypothetical protein [Haliscomenobacter sp.]|uniref:hypothetical protein n=1 Tax=Haliscomenobacter sp. TaxID=2717303 RepID=UPI003BAB57A5